MDMPWKLVRLELGPTEEFPSGSAVRAYCLRVPLGNDGRIEAHIHATYPLRATARRFWPNEPDLAGYLVRKQSEWHMEWRSIGSIPGEGCWFADCAIVEGATLKICAADRTATPYVVRTISGG